MQLNHKAPAHVVASAASAAAAVPDVFACTGCACPAQLDTPVSAQQQQQAWPAHRCLASIRQQQSVGCLARVLRLLAAARWSPMIRPQCCLWQWYRQHDNKQAQVLKCEKESCSPAGLCTKQLCCLLQLPGGYSYALNSCGQLVFRNHGLSRPGKPSGCCTTRPWADAAQTCIWHPKLPS